MIVIVCGGRDWRDETYVHARLNVIHATSPITEVHQGGARGVDTMARTWAERKGIPCFEYRAEWNEHGKRAGPIRNCRMLLTARPDVVIAFPGGSGTRHMMKIASDADIHIINLQKGMTK